MAIEELETRTSEERLDMDAEKTISTMTITSASGSAELVMKCGMILSHRGTPFSPMSAAGRRLS